MSVFNVQGDVYGIDIGMFEPEVLSTFFIEAPEPTLVDTGTRNGIDNIHSGLRTIGVELDDLEHIVISHIHIDHCGGAGELVKQAPDATVYIQESTAQHLVDPSSLIGSSQQAMGRHFKEMGAPKPVPENRITTIPTSGSSLDIGSRSLKLVPTPGHSPDHLSVYDSEEDILFANEGIGEYLPKAESWLPPATLPKFDIETVTNSIERLQDLKPSVLALAHFGIWDEDPNDAFNLALDRLAYFNEYIPKIYNQTGDLEETTQQVSSELLGLESAYGEDVCSFYARLQTQGVLKANGLL